MLSIVMLDVIMLGIIILSDFPPIYGTFVLQNLRKSEENNSNSKSSNTRNTL